MLASAPPSLLVTLYNPHMGTVSRLCQAEMNEQPGHGDVEEVSNKNVTSVEARGSGTPGRAGDVPRSRNRREALREPEQSAMTMHILQASIKADIV